MKTVAVNGSPRRNGNTRLLLEAVLAPLAKGGWEIGSPTYFADITPEAKALIDRAGYVSLANGGLFGGKIGAGVIAVRRAGAVHALDSINHMFLICRMIVPGSTYWNIGFGREAGEVAADAEGLANMDHLGRAIAWLGKAIVAGGEAYPGPKAD